MKMKSDNLAFFWKIEGVGLLITTVFTVLIMLPIYSSVPEFPFLIFNISTIFVFCTLMRYLFLLRFTPFSRIMIVKACLIFLTLPMLVYLIDGLAEFQFELDENGIYSMVAHINVNEQISLAKYIRSEFIFFAVGAIIATIILPVRMIISIWRVKNRNKV